MYLTIAIAALVAGAAITVATRKTANKTAAGLRAFGAVLVIVGAVALALLLCRKISLPLF